jgi:hypothetical protein
MRYFGALFCSSLLFVSVMATGPAPALASPSYELVTTTPGSGTTLYVYRINVASGEVSNVSNTPIINMTDPQPIPAGNYRLFIVTQSNGTTYWIYRLETESGRTWFLTNNTWKEVTAK